MQWSFSIATGLAWLLLTRPSLGDSSQTLTIDIARNVTAGASNPVKVNYSSNVDLSSLTGPVSVEIYDSISNWPICLLGHTSLSKLTDSFEIPPSVGPSGLYYRLAFTPGTSTDPYNMNGSWPFGAPEYTNLFFLSGATSRWSSAEAPDDENSYGLGRFFSAYLFNLAGEIPCSSYDCARNCSYRQLPYQEAWEDGQEWRTCLEACPGVTLTQSRLESIAAATDGGGVPTPTTASVAATPSGCDAADFRTPCGSSKCCGPREYCLNWRACIELGSDDDDTVTSVASSTATGDASTVLGSRSSSAPTQTLASSTSTGAAAPVPTPHAAQVPAAVALLWIMLQ